MNVDESVKALEASIQRAKLHIELGDALEKLATNREFTEVVLKGYFEQEAIRLVHLKADPALQNPDSQASIVRQMDAIGNLKAYFLVLRMNASLAGKEIADANNMIEEIMFSGSDE